LWECHIEPDWLLIWHETEKSLTLTRTGTQADLFE
jgi:mRNA interferase YafQ